MFHVKRSREGGDVSRETKEGGVPVSGGVCLLCRLPTLSFVCLSAPIPPTPFPRGEGGDFWFSYARGSAPCIPGAEPGRHRSRGAYHALAGGLPGWLPADLAVPESAGVACFVCRLPTLPLAFFLAPLPRRGRIAPSPALAERSSRRHRLFLPRGRGPSQTPKFLSPGLPSPWLPAKPIERRFYRLCAELATPKAHPHRVPAWEVL